MSLHLSMASLIEIRDIITINNSDLTSMTENRMDWRMTTNSQAGEDDKKAQVQDYFSRNAEGYVASFSHRQGGDLDRLIELGEWDSSQRALDVATGGGHTALAVAPHVGRITVTDLTPRMLEKAREFILAQGVTNAVFQEADAENLPFADSSFERVTCRIAPHHFPDMARFVREVAREAGIGHLTEDPAAVVIAFEGAEALVGRRVRGGPLDVVALDDLSTGTTANLEGIEARPTATSTRIFRRKTADDRR